MTQPTETTNAELSRRYIDAVLADDSFVHRHGADRVLKAANTLAVLAVVDAVREGPTSLRECIEALAPQLRPTTAQYEVGDPDPTPDSVEDYCPALDGGHGCCWAEGHVGPHVAGSSDGTILAVWS